MPPLRLLGALLLATSLALPARTGAEPTTVDRLLASVDEDPILLSDLERALELGLVEGARSEESPTALHRRLLEELIDQRLRFHEVDRYGLSQIDVEAIRQATEQIRSRFADEATYQAHLAVLGLNEDAVTQLVARQLAVWAYVDTRLAARVLVGLEEIRGYYEGELVPKLEVDGAPVPPLEEVRETIRELLRQRRLNEELARWTDELEAKADVVRYSLEPARPLPPLIESLEAPTSEGPAPKPAPSTGSGSDSGSSAP
jgi:hypothetical protein